MRILVLMVISLGLYGCGGSSSSESKSESYTYQYSVNGCDTGRKTFSSKQAYCDSLKNSQANNGCALDARYRAFEQNCQGQSWQSN